MQHSDIEHMAQGYPPSHIGEDSEEVVVWLATQLLATQEQRDALAAENSALLVRLSSFIDIVSKADNLYCMCGERMDSHVLGGCGSPIGMLDYHFGKLTEEKAETPATDAYLNSVRAEGVEMAASDLFETTAIGHGMLMAFASQLRAGEPS